MHSNDHIKETWATIEGGSTPLPSFGGSNQCLYIYSSNIAHVQTQGLECICSTSGTYIIKDMRAGIDLSQQESSAVLNRIVHLWSLAQLTRNHACNASHLLNVESAVLVCRIMTSFVGTSVISLSAVCSSELSRYQHCSGWESRICTLLWCQEEVEALWE